MTRWLPWPSALTKTPEMPSTYQRPRSSRTRIPSPCVRISGSSPNAFICTKSTISRCVSELRSSTVAYRTVGCRHVSGGTPSVAGALRCPRSPRQRCRAHTARRSAGGERSGRAAVNLTQRFSAGVDQFVDLAEVHVGVGHAVRPAESVLIQDVFQGHIDKLQKILGTRQVAEIVVRITEHECRPGERALRADVQARAVEQLERIGGDRRVADGDRLHFGLHWLISPPAH